MPDDNHGRHKKILDWSDERGAGNSIIVTLIRGFAFEPNEDERAALHVRGFDAVKDAMNEVRAAKPCPCGRCKGEGEA
jgi:hypothetical protein